MSEKKSKDMKPDKNCHTGSDYKTAKPDTRLPGQMYVPKTNHNEITSLGKKVNK